MPVVHPVTEGAPIGPPRMMEAEGSAVRRNCGSPRETGPIPLKYASLHRSCQRTERLGNDGHMPRAAGLDASDDFVRVARARLPAARFATHDVTAMPLPGTPADVIAVGTAAKEPHALRRVPD